MYGLYCDADWSRAEFQKWAQSRTAEGVYHYASYLDPYPHMPYPAQRLISVVVPEMADRDNEGRLRPHRRLAEYMWPHLVDELTFDPAVAQSLASDSNRRAAQFNAGRPVLSGIALIMLERLSEADARNQFATLPAEQEMKLIALAASRPNGGQRLRDALDALQEGVITDFISPPSMW
jgi:hypothetical protein